jgi:peptidoglycan/xylan/chitin deacetylase (PgdA/CDA1 family)
MSQTPATPTAGIHRSLADRIGGVITRHIPVKPVEARFDRPVASFTFDDFPRSAWTTGGAVLARFGARATYYASGRYCGVREDGLDYYQRDDLRAAAAAGHEIGSHSFGHLRGNKIGEKELLADLEANEAFLGEALGGRGSVSFAYPYGECSPRTKALTSARFMSCRGIAPGVNRGRIDLSQLKAAPLEARSWSAAGVEALVADVAARGGWLIFFSHDVSDSPSPYGATPAMLEHCLATLAAAGIASLPVKAALAAGTFREAA